MHPAAASSFLPATRALLSEDVATAKLGRRLNLNGACLNGGMPARLAGGSSFQGLILTGPPVNLNISATGKNLDQLFTACPAGSVVPERTKVDSGSFTFRVIIFHFLLLFYWPHEQRDTTQPDMWDKQPL